MIHLFVEDGFFVAEISLFSFICYESSIFSYLSKTPSFFMKKKTSELPPRRNLSKDSSLQVDKYFYT